jgi:hypothetical protein
LDLIHRIRIQRPGSKRAGLTSLGGLDRGGRCIRSRRMEIRRLRSCASGGGGAWPAAARRHGGAGRRLAGALRHRRWGAPNATGTAPGRSAANGEHNGALQRQRRPRETAGDGEARRRSSGEDGGALRNGKSRTKHTNEFLTFTHDSRSATRRRDNGGRAKPSGGRSRVCAAATEGGR